MQDPDTTQHPFRLLPSEQVVWESAPVAGAPRHWQWILTPALFAATATVAALCTALLYEQDLPGVVQVGWMAVYLAALGATLWLAPSIWYDACEYMVTDRRILWRRGRLQRWMDAGAISYARIHWNRARNDVGDLELVRATAFGPLMRKQRLRLRNVRMPDKLLAQINRSEPGAFWGDAEVPLADRLRHSERVLWGDHPRGALLSVRNLLTAALGVVVLSTSLQYTYRVWSVLLHLELLGLQVRSWTWLLLFSATTLSCLIMLGVGAGLVWHGLVRSRALGRQTEYLITTERVVIRRGRVELYVDRRNIVDVAVLPAHRGVRHLFLILDTPEGRALSDSGALTPFPPARDQVAPIMYELADAELVCRLLLGMPPTATPPRLEDAA